MKHYFFKFQSENKGLELWLADKKNQPTIPLSIYYGKNGNWASTEYKKGLQLQTDPKSKNQIELFFNLQKKSKSDTYFWIFHFEKIFCFKGTDLKVQDGPSLYVNDANTTPKSITAKEFNVYLKIQQPDFFANCNSNQKYNRGTISEFHSSEKKYASVLVAKDKLFISKRNFHEYLSPMEFETLVFLIFMNNSCLCSAYRGGTLKQYDLKVLINKEFHGIKKGKWWLQIKKKDVKKQSDHKLFYFSTTDNTSLKDQLIGIDWIIDRINEDKRIINWLSGIVFNYSSLVFSWDGS